MIDNSASHAGAFDVRVLRQPGPGTSSYWERHRVPQEPDMNVISVLQHIAAHPVTVDGKTQVQAVELRPDPKLGADSKSHPLTRN